MIPSMLLFLDISGGELALIVLFIFIVLGPDKLPEIARKFGKIMRFIRKATDDIKREINIDEDLIQKPRSYSYTKKTSLIEKKTSPKPSVDNSEEKATKSEDNKTEI
ncbi:MAG: twin-arginine translocase TatA/TatE family subunit [Bacteroidales bacterium]|nr:twin-arginine translocase TatA/TatE family subunit [Bacteroidales bacterium]